MKRWARGIAIAMVVLGSGMVVGCGGNSVGSATPPGTNPQNGTSTSPPAKSTTSTSKNQPSTKSKQTGSTSKSGKSSTSSPSAPPRTVTIKVGSETLAPAAVSVTGTSSTFVPLSSTQKTVLLPIGWTLSSSSLGGGATQIKLVNPKDGSQMVSEVVRPSSMNLQGFYAARSPGTATWMIKGQAIEFGLNNPNLPYLDRGIVANTSGGGSIRVDVYLPQSEKLVARQILDSFAGVSGSGS